MGKLFAGAEESVKVDHREYPFLVEIGWGHMMVQCPICLARNSGWWKDGSPRYSGGWVDVEIPDGKKMCRAVAACLCVSGEIHAAKAARFTDLPPAATFLTRPAKIVWTLGDKDPKPRPPFVPNLAKYGHKCAGQAKRYMDGEITLGQFDANLKEIADRMEMPPLSEGPTIYEILNSSLRSAYITPRF